MPQKHCRVTLSHSSLSRLISFLVLLLGEEQVPQCAKNVPECTPV